MSKSHALVYALGGLFALVLQHFTSTPAAAFGIVVGALTAVLLS